MSLVKIGILGCADIANKYMIPAILNLKKNFKIVGVSSRNLDKLKKFSETFKIDPYDKYEDILSIKNINAIYIPLPNSLCFNWIEKSLKKGIHVIVEKSMVIDLVQAKYLNKLAKNNKLILLENFQFRFHKQISYIKEIIKNGEIGELRSLKSSFGFPPFKDPKNIRYSKVLGGGSLLDVGVYPIKIAQIFMGQNITIADASLFYDQDRGIDIWGGAYIKQINGSMFSQISFGFDNFYQCNLEIWGSQGKVLAERIFTSPPKSIAKINLETEKNKKIIEIDAFNHFESILLYFYKSINKNYKFRYDEYKKNINQARLVSELRTKANQK